MGWVFSTDCHCFFYYSICLCKTTPWILSSMPLQKPTVFIKFLYCLQAVGTEQCTAVDWEIQPWSLRFSSIWTARAQLYLTMCYRNLESASHTRDMEWIEIVGAQIASSPPRGAFNTSQLPQPPPFFKKNQTVWSFLHCPILKEKACSLMHTFPLRNGSLVFYWDHSGLQTKYMTIVCESAEMS